MFTEPILQSQSQNKLSRERLSEMQTLEFEIKTDMSETLKQLRETTGADLQPRPDGFHLTIIGPTESKILSALNAEKIAELEKINTQIKSGEGIIVKGIGFIDGANSPLQMREVDKVKKTAFIALDIPALQEFRAQVGLPPKDFHMTIGFVGGDIHNHIIGQEIGKNGKAKDLLGPIPKQADKRFISIPLPEMQFGELDGQLKEKKQ